MLYLLPIPRSYIGSWSRPSPISLPLSALSKLVTKSTGKSVRDGFFNSMSTLNSSDMTRIYSSPSYKSAAANHTTIRKICTSGLRIPPITSRTATEILYSIKPDVNDLYSVTARHYTNAGVEEARHFHILMNLVISNLNLLSLPELNSVWAMVLYKAHSHTSHWPL